jgi:hypothetical protein
MWLPSSNREKPPLRRALQKPASFTRGACGVWQGRQAAAGPSDNGKRGRGRRAKAEGEGGGQKAEGEGGGEGGGRG